MKSTNSVRPCDSFVSSGLGAKAEEMEGVRKLACASIQGEKMKAVFPIDESSNVEELEAAAEEEDVVCPPCLPTPYQPTRSEYLDHCVTHYPFRAWCRHCLEGRGR